MDKVYLVCLICLFAIGCSDDNKSITPTSDGGVITKKDTGGSTSVTWKICRDNTECKGKISQCVKLGSNATGMCSAQCNAQNPCPAGGYCISAVNAGLYPSCAKGCSTVTDCPTGMKCATTKDNIKACVPDGWNLASTSTKCTENTARCNGMYISMCIKGAWETAHCDSVCINAGYSKATSCSYDSAKKTSVCNCSNVACTDGQQKCVSSNLAQCKNGKWVTETCNSLCIKGGFGKASSCGYDSTKGMDTCFCMPKSCTNGQAKCAGNQSLSVCESGSWQTYTCDSLCKKSGYSYGAKCGYDTTTSVDTCFCFNGKIGDKCKYTSDCKQGVCGSHGWCSKACTKDADCGYNSQLNKNRCMMVAGGNACFPGCSSTLADCLYYPGAICQFGVNANGSKVKGCSP